MVTLQSLTPYAVRLTQSPHSLNAHSNLVLRLQLVTDVGIMRQLATRFALNPEVGVLVWRRLATLQPDDMQLKLEAAYYFYSNGLDAEALQLVEGILATHDQFVPAWELRAVLCADAKERRQIFERILKLEPGNRTAVDNLIILGRPTT